MRHAETGHPVVVGVVQGGHISCVQDSYYGRVDHLAWWIDEEMDWFNSDAKDTAGGSSIGTRRTTDVCSTVPRPLRAHWAAVLALLALVWAGRRRVPSGRP